MSGFNRSPSTQVRRRPRRLNKVPLIIVAVVVAAFAGIIVYTAEQRAQHQQKQMAQATDGAPEAGTPPGFLNKANATSRPPAEDHHENNHHDNPQPPSPGPAVAMMDDPRVKAWQSYYSEMSKLQQDGLDAEIKAMQADTVAWTGDKDKGQQGDTGGSGAGQSTTLAALTGQGGGMGDGGLPTAGTDANGQAEKRAFLNQKGDPLGADEDVNATKHAPKLDTIMATDVLPGIMFGGLTTDMPGTVVAMINEDVHDPITKDLLIPWGTKVEIKYDNSVSVGQRRVGVISQRLIFPDRSSIQMGSMEVADQTGQAGLHDITNTHFWEKLGGSLVVALVGAGAQLSQPAPNAFSAYSPTSTATASLTQQMMQFTQGQAQAYQAIPNTNEVRAGFPIRIVFHKDLYLGPYVDHRNAPAVMSGPVLQ